MKTYNVLTPATGLEVGQTVTDEELGTTPETIAKAKHAALGGVDRLGMLGVIGEPIPEPETKSTIKAEKK